MIMIKAAFSVFCTIFAQHIFQVPFIWFRLTSAEVSWKVPENCQAKVVKNIGLFMNRLYDFLGKIGLLCFLKHNISVGFSLTWNLLPIKVHDQNVNKVNASQIANLKWICYLDD